MGWDMPNPNPFFQRIWLILSHVYVVAIGYPIVGIMSCVSLRGARTCCQADLEGLVLTAVIRRNLGKGTPSDKPSSADP